MLDIRAIHYPSPLSEVDFASVPLSVRLKNYADETGQVTGWLRVYNGTTGLMVHMSYIAPVSVEAGVTVDATALTDFDPPAPADDVYFVIFDGIATNALVPDGISFQRGAFYFDVKPVGMGPAPAAHHATHEAGGSDEVDVTGLSGLLADEQDPLDHHADHEAGGGDVVDHDAVHFAKLHPAADSTTAVRILKADNATPVVTIDTSNARLGINTTPGAQLHVYKPSGDTELIIQSGTASVTVDVRLLNATRSWMFGLSINGVAGQFEIADVTAGFLTRLAVDTTGRIGIGTILQTAFLDIASDIIRLRTAKTPATAGAAGNKGDICWDDNYIYVCVATNTWKRAAIATW